MWGPARQTSWLLILIKILHYATRSLPLKEGVPATWRHVLRAGEAKNLPAHLFLTGARSNSRSRAECYAGNTRGKSNRSTSEKAHICHLAEWVALWEGPAFLPRTAMEPLNNTYKPLSGMPRKWDDTGRISAEVRCREDRAASADLNKWHRLLWKPQAFIRSTSKTKQSEADFISTPKMFMTRKGKVGVKCFLAKSIVPALDEEVLWIRSTHRTSSVLNPRRTIFCTLPVLWYKNSGFLTPSWHPVSF